MVRIKKVRGVVLQIGPAPKDCFRKEKFRLQLPRNVKTVKKLKELTRLVALKFTLTIYGTNSKLN